MYNCFICGQGIKEGVEAEHPLDPCASVLISNIDSEDGLRKEQTFYCHAKCYQRVSVDKESLYIFENYFPTQSDLDVK